MTVNTSYCTLDEVKQLSGVSDTIDDAILTADIAVASRKIDAWTGRVFYQEIGVADAATQRVFCSASPYTVYVDDFWTTTGFVLESDNADVGTYTYTWTSISYVIEPENQQGPSGRRGWPYSMIRTVRGLYFQYITRPNNIRVTAKWGWAAVPDEVNMACRFLAHRLYWMRNAPTGVTGVADLGITRIRSEADIASTLDDFRIKPILIG